MVKQHWLQRHRAIFLLVVLNFLSFILIVNDKSATELGLRSLLRDQISTINEKLNYFGSLESYRQENLILKEENTKLRLEKDNLAEITLQNLRFRRLYNLANLAEFNYKMAIVLGEDPNYSDANIIVNRGRRDSIGLDMAVVSAKGLVGRIIYVGEKTSVVQLLLDKNIRVSCRSQRSRSLATITWSSGNLLELKYYPKTAELNIGDIIVTSGMSNIYPKGIRIGIVKKIENPKYAIFKSVIVEPASNFYALEEVFIVQKRKQSEK